MTLIIFANIFEFEYILTQLNKMQTLIKLKYNVRKNKQKLRLCICIWILLEKINNFNFLKSKINSQQLKNLI